MVYPIPMYRQNDTVVCGALYCSLRRVMINTYLPYITISVPMYCQNDIVVCGALYCILEQVMINDKDKHDAYDVRGPDKLKTYLRSYITVTTSSCTVKTIA